MMHKSKSNQVLEIDHIQELHDHWANCKSLIDVKDDGVHSISKIDTVFYHVSKIILLVVDEHSSDALEGNKLVEGSYLETIIKCNIFELLLIWIEANPTPKDDKSICTRDVLRRHLITTFEQLITQSKQNVLLYRPILQPLCQFLFKLSSQLRPSYDQIYGHLLHEVCILLCRNFQLLEFSKELCKEIFNQPYMIFSLLVPLVHRNDPLGDSARDSLLIIFGLSNKDDSLGQYLAYESDICPILATGLSGLYSSLPKKLVPRYGLYHNHNGNVSLNSPGGPVSVTTPIYIQSDLLNPCLLELQVGGAEWHQLTESECSNSIDLRRFLHTLHFCNLTIKIAHPHVRDQLLYFIHSGFLVPVLGSALHQSAMDEVIAATAYLELFLRRLTEPSMIKLFLKFIITESHDSYHILTSIMNRLNANAMLGMVTLSLFRTILSFHCEDVMYELIFKHLLALNHLDSERFDSSPNGLHKTLLTGSALCLSNNGTTQQPKLLWSTSPRSTVKHTTYYHPTVDQLIPHLVKSAELFLSLANTSSCNDKFSKSRCQSTTTDNSEVGTTQLKNEKRQKSSISYCPIEKLCNVSKEVIFSGHGDSVPTIDPLTSLNRSNNFNNESIDDDDDDDNDDDDDLNKTLNNEWVVIRSTPLHPILVANNYPELINYIKNANLRVSRRRQACKSWRSQYWPKMTEDYKGSQSTTSPVRDDYLLELQEKRSRCDLYRTIRSSKYTNSSGCVTPDLMPNGLSARDRTKFMPDTVDNGSKNEWNSVCDDISLSSPLLLHSLSSKHASSLYQLNYINDSSDDESSQENMKQSNNSNTTDNNTTLIAANNSELTVSETDALDKTINSCLPTDKQLSNSCSTESFHSTTMDNKQPQIQSSELSTTLKMNSHEEGCYNTGSSVPCNLTPTNSTPSCTCLSTLPDLLRLAHLDPSIELHNSNLATSTTTVCTKTDFNERQEYELENFLAALDCLPSPGHCPKHFGHLPPFISYSKIDEEFFKKLDDYIHEFENSKIKFTEADSSTVSSTTITNDNPIHNCSDNDDEGKNDAETKSKLLQSSLLSSLMVRSCNDALDSISLNRLDLIHQQQCQNSGSHSSCSNHSHLTDFSSTSSTQSAKHYSNSVGVAGGIGPFLSILLNRLANMHNNCFFTNLLLTDIFAALASYPCPLLYEFLLNPIGLSIKPSVNTLYKVLRSVHSQIVVASESVEQWKSLVFRARVYLNIVWPGPFKMKIDPNFYTTKENSQRNKTKMMATTTEHQSNTTYSSKRGVSEDKRNISSCLSRNSLLENSNHHSPLNTINKDSLQHVVPLLPVTYSLPINNDNKANSKRLHRSSISGGSNHLNLRHRSHSRVNQFLNLTSRIGLSPVLKRASLHHGSRTSSSSSSNQNYTNNKSKFLNSGSDEEDQNDVHHFIGNENSNNSTNDNPFYSDPTTDITIKTRNLVFASIIFDEFCFELAALCYEHSLNPDIHLNKSNIN
uniref:FHF complex subunit HOOK-interacting protein C-terminal domain-containing protein n=1 Tax=Schistosoma mansoni TaxID=6183 RepID=A0A5K4ERH5_SCHMA